MKARLTIILVSGALLLSACMVGPDYSPPNDQSPRQFGESVTNAPMAEDLTQWWTSFDDPILNKLIADAAQANLDVKIAETRIRQARALAGASRADLFPIVGTLANYSRTHSSTTTSTSPSASDSSGATDSSNGSSSGTSSRDRDLFEAGFDATWEIDIFGGVRRQVEAAERTLEAAIEARRLTLVTLLAEVATNYIALRSAQLQLQIAERALAAEQETAEIQRMRLGAGITNDLTVAQSEALVESTRSDIPTLHTATRQAIHRLSVLLGREPLALDTLLSPVQAIPGAPTTVDVGIPSELLRRRPDVRQAERELAAQTSNIGVAVADLFPRLTLNGAIGVRSNRLGNLFDGDSGYWSAGPSISWQILNAYAVQYNIDLQTARRDQALLAYQSTVLQAFADVESAIVAFQQEQTRQVALEKAFSSNRRALALAQQLNTAGVVDFLNVLVTQQAVFSSERELARNRQAVATNRVALYKALGGGWERLE